MIQYVTGITAKFPREKKGYTQRQLVDLLTVNDKVVSKWETQHGLSDIFLLEPLAKAPGVFVVEPLSGEQVTSGNCSGNMLCTCIYVYPVYDNAIHSLGRGSFTCCGVTLPVWETEEADEAHGACVQQVENEYYATLRHPMEESHFISFLALVTPDQIRMKKLYLKQNSEARFAMTGVGTLHTYYNRRGLFRVSVSLRGEVSWK